MIADKLEAAAAVVHTGWCQGVAGRTATGDPRGSWRAPDVASRCIRGAIHYVLDGDMVSIMAVEQIVKLVLVRDHDWRGGLASWNDMPGRRQHEVVHVLLAAADSISPA